MQWEPGSGGYPTLPIGRPYGNQLSPTNFQTCDDDYRYAKVEFRLQGVIGSIAFGQTGTALVEANDPVE